jgi:hypothetical protein
MISRTNDVKQYLLQNSVEQNGPLDTPCLIWTRGTAGKGYGWLQYRISGDARLQREKER